MDSLFTAATTPAVPIPELRAQGLLQATDLPDAVRVDESGKEIVPESSGYAFHPMFAEAKEVHDALQVIHDSFSGQQAKPKNFRPANWLRMGQQSSGEYRASGSP